MFLIYYSVEATSMVDDKAFSAFSAFWFFFARSTNDCDSSRPFQVNGALLLLAGFFDIFHRLDTQMAATSAGGVFKTTYSNAFLTSGSLSSSSSFWLNAAGTAFLAYAGGFITLPLRLSRPWIVFLARICPFLFNTIRLTS